MVPVQRLGFETEGQDKREYYKRNALLDDLELDQVKGATVDIGSYAVSRNHDAVLKERHAPGSQDDYYKRPVRAYLHFLKLKVTVPCKRHKNIGNNQKNYCPETFHKYCIF